MKQQAALERRALRIEEEHRQAILISLEESVLVRCVGCGLEQVDAGEDRACVLCGGEIAEFVGNLITPEILITFCAREGFVPGLPLQGAVVGATVRHAVGAGLRRT